MSFSDPIAAYNAANNVEAHLVCRFLEQTGIEAYVAYDESFVGFGWLGALPEIHKPQVWIDKSNREAAATFLREYEEALIQRRRASRARDRGRDTIDAICEDCGKTSTFAAVKKGTTQDCKHCGAYIDVGDAEEIADALDSDE